MSKTKQEDKILDTGIGADNCILCNKASDIPHLCDTCEQIICSDRCMQVHQTKDHGSGKYFICFQCQEAVGPGEVHQFLDITKLLVDCTSCKPLTPGMIERICLPDGQVAEVGGDLLVDGALRIVTQFGITKADGTVTVYHKAVFDDRPDKHITHPSSEIKITTFSSDESESELLSSAGQNLATNFVKKEHNVGSLDHFFDSVRHIKINSIVDRLQLRDGNNPSFIESMLQNFDLKQVGQLIVQDLGGGTYLLIDGNHRLEVMEKLGYEEIPVVIYSDIDALKAKMVAYTANTNKQPFRPSEKIRIIADLWSEATAMDPDYTYRDFERDTGEKKSTVHNYVKIADMHMNVLGAIDGGFSQRSALMLSELPYDDQAVLVRKFAEEGINSTEVEYRVDVWRHCRTEYNDTELLAGMWSRYTNLLAASKAAKDWPDPYQKVIKAIHKYDFDADGVIKMCEAAMVFDELGIDHDALKQLERHLEKPSERYIPLFWASKTMRNHLQSEHEDLDALLEYAAYIRQPLDNCNIKNPEKIAGIYNFVLNAIVQEREVTSQRRQLAAFLNSVPYSERDNYDVTYAQVVNADPVKLLEYYEQVEIPSEVMSDEDEDGEEVPPGEVICAQCYVTLDLDDAVRANTFDFHPECLEKAREKNAEVLKLDPLREEDEANEVVADTSEAEETADLSEEDKELYYGLVDFGTTLGIPSEAKPVAGLSKVTKVGQAMSLMASGDLCVLNYVKLEGKLEFWYPARITAVDGDSVQVDYLALGLTPHFVRIQVEGPDDFHVYQLSDEQEDNDQAVDSSPPHRVTFSNAIRLLMERCLDEEGQQRFRERLSRHRISDFDMQWNIVSLFEKLKEEHDITDNDFGHAWQKIHYQGISFEKLATRIRDTLGIESPDKTQNTSDEKSFEEAVEESVPCKLTPEAVHVKPAVCNCKTRKCVMCKEEQVESRFIHPTFPNECIDCLNVEILEIIKGSNGTKHSVIWESCTADYVWENWIGEGSVDLIITSPPYGVGKPYDMLNPTSDVFTEEGYTELAQTFLKYSYYSLKPGGRLAINVMNVGKPSKSDPASRYRRLDDLYCTLAEEAGFLTHGKIIWVKQAGNVGNKHGSYISPSLPHFQDVYEFILVFSKPGVDGNLVSLPAPNCVDDKQTIDEVLFNRLKKSVWTMPTANGSDHPCTFPEELVENLIQLYTWPCPATVVVDPFAGSGTTAAVAKRLGRSSYSIERSKQHIPGIVRRVVNVEVQRQKGCDHEEGTH